ncbi:hypothetical protein LOTGIDRAFT_135850, partial [Lottia gigantea]
RPHLREIRTIHIEKTAEPVGFQIQPGPEGGIFVSSVSENSLASDAGIVVGDQLLEYNSVDFRSVTAEQASAELSRPCSVMRLLVHFNLISK